LLTFVFFGLLTRYSAAKPETQWILATAFWIYLVAALTDLLDGYLARTWKQVTAFGRVMDPVVDKVMVCGAFVFFASSHFAANGRNIAGVEAWIPVLILLREFLVSAIRSFSESHGVDFAANWVGKIKSFVQFTTVCVILGVLAWFENSLFFWWLRVVCIWATVIITAGSIIAYMQRAHAIVLSPEALGGVIPRSSSPAPAKPSSPTAARRVEGASA
jgi:CDP-diacylglycerol--glycerol-3-phosphate 3-phosphatidyltransferase